MQEVSLRQAALAIALDRSLPCPAATAVVENPGAVRSVCSTAQAFDMTDLAPMQAFSAPQRVLLRQMPTGRVNSPITPASPMGEWADAWAATAAPLASRIPERLYRPFDAQRVVEADPQQSRSGKNLTSAGPAGCTDAMAAV